MHWNWVTSIHQVHVVEALDAVQVALMDGIDPHPARLSERLRAAAFPDHDLHRARRQRRRSAAPLIACRVPQVVQMAVARCRPGVRSGGRRTDGKRGRRACAWPDRTACRGAASSSASSPMPACWSSGAGTVERGVSRRSAISPVVRCCCNRRVIWARDKPATLARKRRSTALVGLATPQGVVEPAHGFRRERVGVRRRVCDVGRSDLLAEVRRGIPEPDPGSAPPGACRVSRSCRTMILDAGPRSGSCVVGNNSGVQAHVSLAETVVALEGTHDVPIRASGDSAPSFIFSTSSFSVLKSGGFVAD